VKKCVCWCSSIITYVVLYRETVILPSKHYTVLETGGVISGPGKRQRMLRPSEISELIFDTESDEARKSSNIISGEKSSESVPGVSQPQRHCQTASCHKSSSSIMSSASDKDNADDSGPREQTQQPVILQRTRPSCPHSSVAHTHTGIPKRKKHNEASHVNDGSIPLRVFLLHFAEIITLLEVETNCYYHD